MHTFPLVLAVPLGPNIGDRCTLNGGDHHKGNHVACYHCNEQMGQHPKFRVQEDAKICQDQRYLDQRQRDDIQNLVVVISLLSLSYEFEIRVGGLLTCRMNVMDSNGTVQISFPRPCPATVNVSVSDL
jgi:hypothetical protein